MNDRATARVATPATPAAPATTAVAAAVRPSVIQLVFREKGALYAAYIPLLTDGGLFVPTARDWAKTSTCCCRCPTIRSATRWQARWPG
jgi:type IV pilus assembly protein PilZ